MITRCGTKMKRGPRGRLRRSIPDSTVRKMFLDYKRLGSLAAAGELHHRAGATIYALMRSRGLIRSRRPSEEFIRKWYADYCSGLSLEEVGEKYGRTRQSIFCAFKYRGFKLRAKKFLPFVIYKGRKYTCQLTGHDRRRRHRYLRETVRRAKIRYLHHVIWEEHNGPIPPGFKVCFKDGDHLNCAIENLELLSNSDQPRKHATGANQFTITAGARLNLLLRRSESGNRSTAIDLKERAA